MNLKRHGRLAALAVSVAAGAMLLAACGSDSNAGGGSSASGSANAVSCQSGSIKASGSSAQANAVAEWINEYQSACTGATINYQSNGSGAGITDFGNNQTAFAGSDAVMKPEEQAKADARCGSGNKAIHIPMVGGAITVAYNVSGLTDLTLTPQVIAGIFSSTITKWDDPAIKALNPSATLPSAGIAQFHRSDSSGTTKNFTQYLTDAAGSAWTYGSDKEWKAPGGQGSKGNEGVSASIKSTQDSIGYVELSFQKDAGVPAAKVDNGGGAVEPNSDTASKSLGLATETGSGNNVTLKLNYATKEAGAYPIVLLTYEITCEKGLPSDELALTKSFLTYTTGDTAQGKLTSIGYVPLSGALLAKVKTAVASIS